MEDLQKFLVEHPFFTDLPQTQLKTLVGCAANVRFNAGEFLFREGQKADHFYLLRHGRVSLEIYTPQRGPLTIETIEEGGVLGWAWLFPPYRRHFDARAVELTRAIALDGKCLRAKAEEDYRLGYNLMTRFAGLMEDRLQRTRLQLVDMYENPRQAGTVKSSRK